MGDHQHGEGSGYCLFTEECWKEGSAEQRRGRHAKEGRKHTADQSQSLCPAHTTAETTYSCTHAQKHIHSVHVNIHIPHIPSLAVIKNISLHPEKCVPYLTKATQHRLGRDWNLSVVRHVYRRKQCSLEQLGNGNQPHENWFRQRKVWRMSCLSWHRAFQTQAKE